MRWPDFGRQSMLCQRALNPRYQIAPIGFVVGVLELASATFREMTARRFLVMRSVSQRAVVKHRIAGNSERNVPPAGGHAITAGRDPDDGLIHSDAMAAGMASARSSAIR